MPRFQYVAMDARGKEQKGRLDAENQQEATNVWADYRVVWHLKETSSTTYGDSTINNIDAVASGGRVHQKGPAKIHFPMPGT